MLDDKILINLGYMLQMLLNDAIQNHNKTLSFEYFNGDISLEDAIEKIKKNSRRFAKRQISWFKRDENIQHIPIENAYQKIIL